MISYRKHIINNDQAIKDALNQLNDLGGKSIVVLFAKDKNNQIIGSLSDGDIRRALLQGVSLSDPVSKAINRNFTYLTKNKYTIHDINQIRDKKVKLVPILNESREIVRIINLEEKRSILPIDAVIMAGGRGKRLQPITDEMPKPLIKIGNKPIIEYNIDRLALYGIVNIYISIKYLGNMIIDYFSNKKDIGLNINFIEEVKPLGTIGSISLVESFEHDYILIMNSDILTNIDLEDFFLEFIKESADMAIATVPYRVDVPYAVLETHNGLIHSFSEKPTYTYYSNGGIYLIKKELIHKIPNNKFFDATDLIEELITLDKKIISFPLHDYWMDIGRIEDLEKAQSDITHIKF